MLQVRKRTAEVNVSDVEHVGAMLAGGALFLVGLRQRGVFGALLKIAGAGMIFRGQQGYRPLYQALGVPLQDGPTGVGLENARVDAEIIINRPREELYRIWRNFENLPIIMDHVISVHEIDDYRSLWVARAPFGAVVKWDAHVINDIPYELIAWETLEGSGVDHAGSVHFDEIDTGTTRVRVALRYDPPADSLGVWLAKKLHADPQGQIQADLHRFKEIMEIGAAGSLATQPEKSPPTKNSRPLRRKPLPL
jgi:uncharacterized membrane protein